MTDATTHLTEEERQTLADGTIDADREQAARAHIRACAACADDVARLEHMIMRGRELEAPTTDVGELWPGIRSRIETTKVVRLPSETAPKARVASRRFVAVAGIAAVLAIALWLGTRAKPGKDDLTVSRGDPGTVASIEFVDDSVRAYKEEAQVLLDRLELTRSMLQPGAAAAIDKDLAVVDSAIAELQTAIARDPRNPELRRLLATSYRQKVEVLMRVSNAG